MKKIIRIYIAIIASVCLFMSLPADIYAVVIDVSSYNGFIQWDNMKNYIEGTIIRIGYGNDIQSQDDAAAIRNMDECERLGIPYGVYLYSYALDYYDAASETAHALRLLKGRSPELGVWFDMEDADLAEFEVFAKKVAKAIKAAFPCKKVAQVVLGLEVNHAHIHLLPMNSEADVDFKHHVKLTETEFEETADKIYKEFQKL